MNVGLVDGNIAWRGWGGSPSSNTSTIQQTTKQINVIPRDGFFIAAQPRIPADRTGRTRTEKGEGSRAAVIYIQTV